MKRKGRPEKIKPSDLSILRKLALEQPLATLDEMVTTGFTVLPKRWVVERTHAWNEHSRRLVMHYGRLTKVSESQMLACRLTG